MAMLNNQMVTATQPFWDQAIGRGPAPPERPPDTRPMAIMGPGRCSQDVFPDVTYVYIWFL